MTESGPSTTKIIDQLSKVVGERDIMPDVLLDKLKDIKDWNLILEHQKQLSKSLHRDISIQAAILDYLLSTEFSVTEAHQIDLPATKKVTYTSIIDPLTGLYNDRHFQIITEAELKRAKKYELPLTIIILDADNFGMYTALYGHETGEMALKEISLIVKNSCRKEDMVFRLKRNMFALLLLNIAREGAHRLGGRLRENIEKFHFKGEEKMPAKKMTVSGGISVYPEDGKNSHTLIIAAEEALSTAKQSGKNRILEYSVKRRKTPRMELSVEAKYQVQGRKDIKPQLVHIKNISESGALLIANKNLSLGGSVILNFKLPNGISINAKGETVRISRKEGLNEISAAIKFSDLTPIDSMNLKNYIQETLGKAR